MPSETGPLSIEFSENFAGLSSDRANTSVRNRNVFIDWLFGSLAAVARPNFGPLCKALVSPREKIRTEIQSTDARPLHERCYSCSRLPVTSGKTLGHLHDLEEFLWIFLRELERGAAHLPL